MPGTFLSAEWRSLVMLNYEVPAEVLEPRVPKGTVLDLFQGRALVSVVGFRFLKTTVLGAAIPGYRDFDEINLRFYVRAANDAARRGVAFVKEIVPHRAIAWTARTLYNENYVRYPMRSKVEPYGDDHHYTYAFDANGRTHALSARTCGAARPLAVGSPTLDLDGAQVYGEAFAKLLAATPRSALGCGRFADPSRSAGADRVTS
jgi:uncharacterized protein YqjF (DUF2071 family)